MIIKRNGLSKALYVGDTQTDCDSAYAAGADFAYASYGFGTADRYDMKLEDISDLVKKPGNLALEILDVGVEIATEVLDLFD